MRSLASALFVFTLFFQVSAPAFAEDDCNLKDLLKVLRNSLTDKYKNVTVNEKATEHLKLAKRKGLDKIGYMSKWSLKRNNQAGPWAMKGNTLVHGIKESDGPRWMEEIGKKSFGLGYFEHPWDVDGTPSAVFRWKDVYLSFSDIQRGDATRVFSSRRNGRSPFTEATFMASEEELEAIKDFLVARMNREVLAQKRVRSRGATYEPGDPISPDFEFTGNNLFEESCANACTSMFNPRWLEHYDAPEALKLALLARDRGLSPEVNAKALIFYNFRNTQADAITIMALPNNTTAEGFLQDNNWNRAGGMMWGFIPDRQPASPSPNYNNERIPFSDWLR